MISLDEIKDEDNFSHSIFVTYPRTIQISHGVYDNVVDMMNMTTMISQNIDNTELTNVYGGKTPWGFFNDKPEFIRFMDYVFKKHSNSNSFFNKNNWYDKTIVYDSWGNQIKKGDHVAMHTHKDYHLILYLTEGAPLILPELKMTITPKQGSYYIFPPHLLHGVKKVESDGITRYCLVSNIIEQPNWKTKKVINDFINEKDKIEVK
jgi:hypothetical protein